MKINKHKRRSLISVYFTMIIALLTSSCSNNIPETSPQVNENNNTKLSFADIFTDNMVLQRNTDIPVWGYAAPNEKILISINGRNKKTTADNNGNWSVKMKPLKDVGPYKLSAEGGNGSKVNVNNILAGDVWICAGQSNMQFTLPNDQWGKSELEIADNEKLRQYRCVLPYYISNKPQDKERAEWKISTSKNAEEFSAIGYYFGKKIIQEKDVPIGIIVMALGNTLCESWMEFDYLSEKKEFAALMDEWNKKTKAKPGEVDNKFYPGLFYREVVAKVIPFAIKGVLWYQGESNALPNRSERTILERTIEYRDLFPALIDNWRSLWNNKVLPFYFVQLPGYEMEGMDLHWAELRDAQLNTYKTVKNTGMVVTTDIGNPKSLHPRNKRDIGNRLADIALNNLYGKKAPLSGPIYQKMTVENGKAKVYFDHVDSGLSSLPLIGFEVSGEDGVFYPATAKVVNISDTYYVEVYSEKVDQPVTVRYGWADSPIGNLYNGNMLPASPFITNYK